MDVVGFAAYERGTAEVPAVVLARIAELSEKPISWFCDHPVPSAPRRTLPPSLIRPEHAAAPLPADQRPCVLLVGNAADVLVTLGAFLEGAGLRVVKARNGKEALRICSQQ